MARWHEARRIHAAGSGRTVYGETAKTQPEKDHSAYPSGGGMSLDSGRPSDASLALFVMRTPDRTVVVYANTLGCC